LALFIRFFSFGSRLDFAFPARLLLLLSACRVPTSFRNSRALVPKASVPNAPAISIITPAPSASSFSFSFLKEADFELTEPLMTPAYKQSSNRKETTTQKDYEESLQVTTTIKIAKCYPKLQVFSSAAP
jgi:hypothetical protein